MATSLGLSQRRFSKTFRERTWPTTMLGLKTKDLRRRDLGYASGKGEFCQPVVRNGLSNNRLADFSGSIYLHAVELYSITAVISEVKKWSKVKETHLFRLTLAKWAGVSTATAERRLRVGCLKTYRLPVS